MDGENFVAFTTFTHFNFISHAYFCLMVMHYFVDKNCFMMTRNIKRFYIMDTIAWIRVCKHFLKIAILTLSFRAPKSLKNVLIKIIHNGFQSSMQMIKIFHLCCKKKEFCCCYPRLFSKTVTDKLTVRDVAGVNTGPPCSGCTIVLYTHITDRWSQDDGAGGQYCSSMDRL